ncbi:MAG: hypothetical protein RR653_05005 [Clostridia bacterium]
MINKQQLLRMSKAHADGAEDFALLKKEEVGTACDVRQGEEALLTPLPLLETYQHESEGIGGVIAFEEWQTCILNYLPRLAPERVMDMQRHTETDEVFVLLKGKVILFVADGRDAPHGELYATELQHGKAYRVKKNVWHTQTMSPDGKVLLVENRNTVVENSPRCPLSEAQRHQLQENVAHYWPC